MLRFNNIKYQILNQRVYKHFINFIIFQIAINKFLTLIKWIAIDKSSKVFRNKEWLELFCYACESSFVLESTDIFTAAISDIGTYIVQHPESMKTLVDLGGFKLLIKFINVYFLLLY